MSRPREGRHGELFCLELLCEACLCPEQVWISKRQTNWTIGQHWVVEDVLEETLCGSINEPFSTLSRPFLCNFCRGREYSVEQVPKPPMLCRTKGCSRRRAHKFPTCCGPCHKGRHSWHCPAMVLLPWPLSAPDEAPGSSGEVPQHCNHGPEECSSSQALGEADQCVHCRLYFCGDHFAAHEVVCTVGAARRGESTVARTNAARPTPSGRTQ